MGVFTFTNEYTSTVPPARLFKALILDFHNLMPKIMPPAIKSVDIIEGDGGAGTIRQINFFQGDQLKSIKNRVDELNEKTFTYRYTIIDIKRKYESIVREVKFEPALDGGSRAKVTDTYNTKGDLELKEEDVRVRKEESEGMMKAAEAYLLKTPMLMLEASKLLLF